MKSSVPLANPFLAVLAVNVKKALWKLMLFYKYLKNYCHSHVKEEFYWCYEFAMKKFDNAMEEERKKEQMKKLIALQMRLEIS